MKQDLKIGGREIMDNWFQSKWFIRVLSLIFAISLYGFVTVETDTIQDESRIFPGSTKELQVLNEVPVDVRIDSEKYVVSGIPEQVTVSLEGKANLLTPIVMQRNFNIYVDLSGLKAGEHMVNLEYDNMPNDISVYIEPETVNIVIEERAMKEATVEVDLVNSAHFPVGYELGDITISPETVNLTSSNAIIDQAAMVKVFLDVGGLTESVKNRVLPVNVYDSQGNDLNVKLEPETVSVSVEVEHPSKSVKVKLPTKGKLPNDLKLKSIKPVNEEIEIFGTRDALEEIDEVLTEVIDLSEIESPGKINVNLDLPSTVVASEEEVEVDIQLYEKNEDE